MDNRMKFYCWVIPLLMRKKLTFEEIANEWRDSFANIDGTELAKRTFHRYRDTIESHFGITVKCRNKDGYRYYVERDAITNDRVTEWMLSSMRLASLADQLKYHNKVMLDAPPFNSGLLDDILRAIDKHYLLKFDYVSAFGAESEVELQPAFIRYFKQRWYVIGVVDGEKVRCFPFDRIRYLKVVCEKHPLPAEMKELLTPEIYYADCFGIYRMENVKPEKIRIRAFYPEYNLIEEVPLHESQEMVRKSEDDMFREYTLTVRPSRDFLQELLWHGRNIIVLQPESLKQEMIGILKDMAKSYETGECLNGEE